MQKLDIAFIWHYHQPDYRYPDPKAHVSLLPWTFLHAVKDYSEMLKIVQQVPGTKVTFNFVPILVEQLAAYANVSEISEKKIKDQWLRLILKPVNKLTIQQRQFIAKHFFSVDYKRHIEPYERFRELHEKNRNHFSDQDIIDLQVYFLLAWSGYVLRQRQPFISYLFNKKQNFTEVEKIGLLTIYFNCVKEIIDAYKQAEEHKYIELSFSPYAHAVLPLLCDNYIAAQAGCSVTALPKERFMHAKDAQLQVEYGKDVIDNVFGERIRGMWPSEGSVSEDALQIIKNSGVTWTATDEAILYKSIPKHLNDTTDHYQLYSYKDLPILFRDRLLSDAIGFIYENWDADQAVDNFIARLKDIKYNKKGKFVTIVLDGENCWEYYADNGYHFLTKLYTALVNNDDFNLMTVSEIIKKYDTIQLDYVAPGSWINGNFDIWIGHEQENKAWDYLTQVRNDFKFASPDLMKAESSDWFWWYGNHFHTEQASMFDRLFRAYLRASYYKFQVFMHKKIPNFLYTSIRKQ